MTFKIEDRRLIEGPRNNLMQIRPVKHQFARSILQTMLDNTWTHFEVDLSEDAKTYATGGLLEGELRAYKCALAFLSNLDGIQLNNLTNNINQHITSPEVNQCLVRQAWEEALHVESYATMIESIGFDPVEVYWMFERDGMLAAKNEYIMRQSMALGEGYSAQQFALAIVANVALEGIYFYNGFLTFYTLARMGKMKNSAKMIKFIQRDEVTHLTLFVNMWHTLKRERPELFTPELIHAARDILRTAAAMEGEWGRYIISGGVMGLTDRVVTDFVAYLAEERAKALGIEPLYDVAVSNPVPWFDKFAQINDSEENFFETKVTAYKASGLSW